MYDIDNKTNGAERNEEKVQNLPGISMCSRGSQGEQCEQKCSACVRVYVLVGSGVEKMRLVPCPWGDTDQPLAFLFGHFYL